MRIPNHHGRACIGRCDGSGRTRKPEWDGAIAGSMVAGSVLFMDRVRIDDVTGAASVHLKNQWGNCVASVGGQAGPV